MSNLKTRVSVIIVNFDGGPFLSACLGSVLNQVYPDFEVICVDNDSSDGSLENAQRTFPQLTFVANRVNTGYAGGVNAGMRHATGKYIVPMNMDAEMAPNCLSAMASFLDHNPATGAVSPKILLAYDTTTVNTEGLNIHVSGLGFCRGLSKKDNHNSKPQRVPGFSGCCYMIRREVLEQMGGLPEECFMGNDDVLASWFTRLLGYEIHTVPETFVRHVYDPKLNPEKLFLLERNREALLFMGLRPLTIVAMSPVFVITDGLILGYCLLRGRHYLRSKLRAWQSLFFDRQFTARIRERRRVIQRARRISDLELLRDLKWNLDWSTILKVSRFSKGPWQEEVLQLGYPRVYDAIPRVTPPQV